MNPTKFDPRRPLFVAQPFAAFGKSWTAETPFPWEDFGMDYQDGVIHQLFANRNLQHRADLEGSLVNEAKKAVGDGLEDMPLDALHNLVEKINRLIKPKCINDKQYSQRKCPSSRIKDKQIGLIRRWRSTYGYMED